MKEQSQSDISIVEAGENHTSIPSPSPVRSDLMDKRQEDASNYLSGWRLHLLTLALCLGLFLANFEISIVSTSLVAITDDLKGFGQSSWVVTAYLLTYMGFLIILAKLSDIFGRKLLILTSVLIFIAFSGACGAAQTITQLIICRAFQGIGGSGIYSIAMVILFEMVPSSKYPTYTALISALFSMSLLLGPLMGGLVNAGTTWRWVFLLNVPAGIVTMVLLIFTLPASFPHHGQTPDQSRSMRQVLSWRSFSRVDFLGVILLLAASIFLVAALQEAGDGSSWASTHVLPLLILSVPFWIGFLAWERLVSREKSRQEPVFPWRFVRSRVLLGLLLDTFFVGVLFTVCVIQLPFRSQAVNDATTLESGVRLLPFAVSCPIGSMVVAVLTGKAKVPLIILLFVGATFQTIGLALMSTLPISVDVYNPQYGFQVITGIGVGISIGSTVLMTPFVIEKRDLAVATAAIVQFRIMGGAIGLAIVTCASNSWIKSQLPRLLSTEQSATLFQTTAVIRTFPKAIEVAVRSLFARGFNMQIRIIIGFAAAQFPATLLMWQRKLLKVH